MAVRVLVVDDTKMIRNSIKDYFDKEFFHIVGEAEDGNQALEEYRKHRPDIVTMDMNMPGCNGVDAIKMILEEDPKAYIIIISSMDDEIVRGLEAGARACIFKPISMTKFRELMGKVIFDIGEQGQKLGDKPGVVADEKLRYEKGIKKNYTMKEWNKKVVYNLQVQGDSLHLNLISEPSERTFNKLVERLKLLKSEGASVEVCCNPQLEDNLKVHFLRMLL